MAGNRPTLYGMALVVAITVSILAAFVPIYIIPVITYLVSFSIGIATKYASCDKVAFESPSKMAVLPTIFSILMIGILTVAPIIKSPIQSMFPSFGSQANDMISQSFYLFWSILYGQIISGGMLQVC